MGIVQLQTGKKNAPLFLLSVIFFPLRIGTQDKTVLQLIQMLLSVILMGAKCNQNTHRERKEKKIPQTFLTAFLISDLDIFFGPFLGWRKEWKSNLIKNAPRCVCGTKTISLHYTKININVRVCECTVHNWPFDLFDTQRNERLSIFNKNQQIFSLFLSIYLFGRLLTHVASTNISRVENVLPQTCELNINFPSKPFGNNRHWNT